MSFKGEVQHMSLLVGYTVGKFQIQKYLFYYWTVYADHLRFTSLLLSCETKSQWFSRTRRQSAAFATCLQPWTHLAADRRQQNWVVDLSTRCLAPHSKPLFFHQYCSQQLREKNKVSQDLILMAHMKEDRTEACRNWVIVLLEIFRAVPSLNYAVSRQLPSDLEGRTGGRSRCFSCPRCGCLSTWTRVTPWKGASIKKRGATQSSHRQGIVSHVCLLLKRQHWCVPDTVPPIQALVWKLVLQSGRCWLVGDLLPPSGNGVLLNSRMPNLSGLGNEGDASTEDALSTHRLLFQWGKGGSCQTLPPLGRNGTFFLVFPLNKNKTF